jgi:DNA repair exonuclease SbcCD nuclease subunit
MKALCCGDQHITKKRPKNRTDDYYKTVLTKFEQELLIAEEEDCSCMLLPGDVFDTFKEDHFVTQAITNICRRHPKIKIFAVAGQHDQQFHNPDLTGTALMTLVTSGVVTLLTKEPIVFEGIGLYGSDWKGEIPEITTPNLINILVLHKMIVEEKLWAAQEGHTWANHILIKNKFDLIVSGDNHTQFVASKGEKHLINMGAMMRSTIAQVNHHPAVVLYDSRTKTIDIIDLEVEPIENVMCVEKAEKEKEKNAQLDAFVSSLKDAELKEGQAIKLDFVGALDDYITENCIEESVADIIYECMEG